MRQESCKDKTTQGLANHGEAFQLYLRSRGAGRLVASRMGHGSLCWYLLMLFSQKGWSSSENFTKEMNVWILLTRVSRSLFSASSAEIVFCESGRSKAAVIGGA